MAATTRRTTALLATAGLLLLQSLTRGQEGDAGFPTYHEVPRDLTFSCADKLPGYYADPETRCQVWHWCLHSGQKFSFLCPNGTVFNQAVRVCDWFYKVNCEDAVGLYGINADLYKDSEGNLIKG